MPKLSTFIIIFLLSVSFKNYAQNRQEKKFTDSVAKALRMEKNIIRKLIDLNALCLVIKGTNPDTAFMYADSGLRVAQTTRQYKYLSVFYEHKGEIYMKWGDFKNSLQQFKLSYIVASKYHSERIMALAINGFGVVYEMQGSFALAQDYFFRALKIAEKIKARAVITMCTINIGVIFSCEKNFGKAVFYADKTLEFNKVDPLPLYEAKAYEILGTANDDRNLHQKARTYYYKALKIYMEHEDQSGMASIYSLLVATYIDDPAMQLKLCFNAKKIYDKIAPNDIYAILNIGNIGIAYDLEARAARKTVIIMQKAWGYFKKPDFIYPMA